MKWLFGRKKLCLMLNKFVCAFHSRNLHVIKGVTLYNEWIFDVSWITNSKDKKDGQAFRGNPGEFFERI